MRQNDEAAYIPYGRLMECGLRAIFIATFLGILYGAGAFGADKPISPPDCWPWWQCNGPKETNHPNCKCWEGK